MIMSVEDVDLNDVALRSIFVGNLGLHNHIHCLKWSPPSPTHIELEDLGEDELVAIFYVKIVHNKLYYSVVWSGYSWNRLHLGNRVIFQMLQY